MAKTLCVLFCVCVIFQTVFCQFGFFQPRENQNGFFQNVFQGPKRIREGIQGLFNPNRQRPTVINQQPPQENVYIVVEEPNNGNVNFERPNQGNDGFQPNTGNGGVIFEGNQYRPPAVDQGFVENQGGGMPQPNNDNGGMIFDGNQYRPSEAEQGSVKNQGNGMMQPNNGNGGVNFDGNQQYQPNGGNQGLNDNQGNNQENKGQEESIPVPPNDPVKFDDSPAVQDTTTTLPPLTPVPTVETESRNNFNFGSTPVFGESCETVDGGLGSCISLYDCSPYLKILQESRTVATQILRKAHCGFDGNTPKVCCPRPGIPTAAPVADTTTTTTTSTTTTTTTTTAPETSPTPITKTVGGDFVPALPDPPICGLSNASLGRVVGGVNANLDDFPWMALLGYKSRRGGTSWLCGGSLISSRHVLTAAHCIHNHENDLYVVRLGELDLAREDEGAHPIDVLIKEKIKHEEYSATAFTNDIAILVLDKDVDFTSSVRPICIPRDTELRSKSYEDYNPLIAGWGHTEFRGPAATHLQVLQLPVVSNDFCSTAYSRYKTQKIDERVLCAGFKAGGKDACQGDSGGPLMQPIWSSTTYKTYFYQIGVVSYGKKCAEAGFPGVYSRVTHFVPWIEKKVLGPR